MNFKTKRRAACISLTAIMALSLALSPALALSGSGKKSLASAEERYDTVNVTDVTGKVDLTGVALNNLSPSVLENAGLSATANSTRTVIVTLDDDCVLDALPDGMEVADYVSSYSGKKLVQKIKSQQQSFLNSLSSKGVNYKVVYNYSTVTNAVAIEVSTAYLKTIKDIANVKTAVVSETYSAPKTVESVLSSVTENPSNVRPSGIYDSSSYLSEYDGSGMTVAILDTGLDYTHEAFKKNPTTVKFEKSDISEALSNGDFAAESRSAANGKNITANDVYVSPKVPYAYDYADHDPDVYPSYSQHGTHVAGIVAGNGGEYYNDDGTVLGKDGNPDMFSGVAPNAQLVICKVFTDDFDSPDLGGAISEDIIAALEDCALLGVDIINMSLGTSAGFSSIYIEGDDEGKALNDIYKTIMDAGINLICAASNEFSSGYGSAFGTNLASNPDSGTVGSPSTFTGALSVASINGQLSPFMIANENDPVFYQDASDANAVKYNFVKQLLQDPTTGEYKQSETFKYVMVPGIGQTADYTQSILNELKDKSHGRTIAVIRRGSTTFQDKIETLMSVGMEDGQYVGADAVIIYNNVAGYVGISLGDIDNPLPTVSVTLDSGRKLAYDENGNRRTTGYIELNTSYQAGPFMNDYSSWGTTPDLKLKPDVTAHGGEITSTVAGGYAEMSGTSMASPNMAGFAALLRSKLKAEHPEYTNKQLTTLSNQIVMSTAITVYDQQGLPVSPRKQGAGLATLANVFTTNAYLSTDNAEDNRPKAELGDGTMGEYSIDFKLHNTGSTRLEFSLQSILMTETLASDGLAVAEKAYLLQDIKPQWKVGGVSVEDGASVFAEAGQTLTINVKLALSESEKRYIETTFENGMFVEGFIKLNSKTDGQCSLTLPFLAFHGDWSSAPMLDYDAYEISEFEQDAQYTDETRPQARVWATQAYATYYNDQYSIPMGSYLYTQDENADQIYVDKEHAAISRYNKYEGVNANGNYMTANTIKALYAGLLRNAELVTYDLYDAETGEIIKKDSVYRVNKAYSRGGSSVPGQVLLELAPDDLGLVNNGKYQIDFRFYFKAEDKDNPEKQNEDNTFSMVFYADYEAPVLEEARIRYYDYKENNKDRQRVYLDLDIYDNHYAQSVILCCSERDLSDLTNFDESPELKLVTDYITPVYNANKNGTTTVSIEITDVYEKYNNRLYVQLDDYALNHRVCLINFTRSSSVNLPGDFEIEGDTQITLGVNQTYKVPLSYEGDANVANFTWVSSRERIAKVKQGEIFAVAEGTCTVTVTGGNGVSKRITVNVVASNTELPMPTISFGTIEDFDNRIVKAEGLVEVAAGQKISMTVLPDPWYYPIENLTIRWETSDANKATADQNGNIQIYDTKGAVSVTASIMQNGIPVTSTVVILDVQEPFTVSNYTLTKYNGTGGVVVVPTDKNIMTIGEEAFKDNNNITKIILPKTVTNIDERAFINCTALEEVYFIQDTPLADGEPKAALATIMRNAFAGCVNLKKFDISNCKVITLDSGVFSGCTSLKEVVAMDKMGTINSNTFMGCTSLEEADITGLHISGDRVFANCTSLKTIKTDYYTAFGASMFEGCTALEEVTLYNPTISDRAFANCTSLETVNFGKATDADKSTVFTIGDSAFRGDNSLTAVNFNGYSVRSIGDYAFAECTALTSFTLPAGLEHLGNNPFRGCNAAVTASSGSVYEQDASGAVYSGTTLVLAPKTINSSFAIKAGTTKIGNYAFSGSVLDGVTTIAIPDSVTEIGEGAFASLRITSVSLPSNLTVIPANAFAGTNLSSITIGAKIKEIGGGAFKNCAYLASVNFVSGTELVKIGDEAFSGCMTLSQITLPDGAAEMGSEVFANCTSLVNANLPSVTELGSSTFAGCNSLTTVAFGANATTAGSYTFTRVGFSFTGGALTYEFTGLPNLTSVALGNGTVSLGNGVFANCTALLQIDLKNVKEIGAYAFAGCTHLSSVVNLNKAEVIGDYAFNGNSALTELNLENALHIGVSAFAGGVNSTNGSVVGANYTVVYLSKVITIGDEAFLGGKEITVNLPASLKELGDGAFVLSSNLRSINVNKDNTVFFSEDGVVYKRLNVISGDTEVYQLCAYPADKTAARDTSNVRTFTIKEGTATVQSGAMAYLNSGVVSKIVIPYTFKTIGVRAFYGSGAEQYIFEAIDAPVLLTYPDDSVESDHLNVHYSNFNQDFTSFVNVMTINVPTIIQTSTAKISYPTNGLGYDNFVYKNYFGEVTLLGELPENDTRTLKTMIENFHSAETVAGWNSLEVNEENKQIIWSFADEVKSAHALLNNIVSEEQLKFIGEENLAKLSAIEEALKPLKTKFSYPVRAISLTVSEESTHKTSYKTGEKFDMTGLVIIVTYDDFTEEVADLSKLTLAAGYDGELTTLNRYVVVQGYGVSVMVDVTVEDGAGDNGGNKTNVGAIVGGVVGGVCGLILIAGAVLFVLWRKKIIFVKKDNAQLSEEVKTDVSEEQTQKSETDGEASVPEEETVSEEKPSEEDKED